MNEIAILLTGFHIRLMWNLIVGEQTLLGHVDTNGRIGEYNRPSSLLFPLLQALCPCPHWDTIPLVVSEWTANMVNLVNSASVTSDPVTAKRPRLAQPTNQRPLNTHSTGHGVYDHCTFLVMNIQLFLNYLYHAGAAWGRTNSAYTLTFKFDATPQGFCQDVWGQHVFKSWIN